MLRLAKNYVHGYYKTLYLEFTIIFFKLYRKILIANCRKIVGINKILILSKKVLDLSMDNFHQLSSRFHACLGNVGGSSMRLLSLILSNGLSADIGSLQRTSNPAAAI